MTETMPCTLTKRQKRIIIGHFNFGSKALFEDSDDFVAELSTEQAEKQHDDIRDAVDTYIDETIQRLQAELEAE